MQNINPTLDSQKSLHTSPSRASYGMSIVRYLKKINHVITAPHYPTQTPSLDFTPKQGGQITWNAQYSRVTL